MKILKLIEKKFNIWCDVEQKYLFPQNQTLAQIKEKFLNSHGWLGWYTVQQEIATARTLGFCIIDDNRLHCYIK